jgi:hypothetical protein
MWWLSSREERKWGTNCIQCPNEENPKQIVDKVEYKTHSIRFFFIVSTFFFFNFFLAQKYVAFTPLFLS